MCLSQALYDYQPSLVDAQLLQAWLTVLQSAYTKLYSFTSNIFIAHLPRLFVSCMECLLSDKDIVKTTAVSVMEVYIKPRIDLYLVVFFLCVCSFVSVLRVGPCTLSGGFHPSTLIAKQNYCRHYLPCCITDLYHGEMPRAIYNWPIRSYQPRLVPDRFFFFNRLAGKNGLVHTACFLGRMRREYLYTSVNISNIKVHRFCTYCKVD